MSNGSRPAILLTDLLRGEGPHRDLADRFIAAECLVCGGNVGSHGRTEEERWLCPTCWGRRGLGS
ncbi:MAG: hypothetical protein V3S62_04570 [Acidimicrobiia bacterium]